MVHEQVAVTLDEVLEQQREAVVLGDALGEGLGVPDLEAVVAQADVDVPAAGGLGDQEGEEHRDGHPDR